jgi:NAD(P)-dependent dehydrogenase (short-subunit alcohol dehydrogenase family)
MTILIYGATGGIGQALARKLAAQGHALHLTARDSGKLEALAASLGARFTPGDVTDPATHTQVAEAAGQVTGLAYAVGSITLKPAHRVTPDDAIADFKLNALGGLQAVQAVLPALKANSGSVVFFSSVAVAQGFSNHASIAMAKGAVEGLTLSLAAELAPKIRVNAIAPSLTRTPLAASLTSNTQMAEAIAALHALQRLGEPDDIASLAAFLLSDEATWMTGQIIGVDGGRSALRTKG